MNAFIIKNNTSEDIVLTDYNNLTIPKNGTRKISTLADLLGIQNSAHLKAHLLTNTLTLEGLTGTEISDPVNFIEEENNLIADIATSISQDPENPLQEQIDTIADASVNDALATSIPDLINTSLDGYSTTAEVNASIATAVSGLASETQVTNEINTALGDYSTTTEVNTLISTATADFVTQPEVDQSIATQVPPMLYYLSSIVFARSGKVDGKYLRIANLEAKNVGVPVGRTGTIKTVTFTIEKGHQTKAISLMVNGVEVLPFSLSGGQYLNNALNIPLNPQDEISIYVEKAGSSITNPICSLIIEYPPNA